jgi:hypothetical protein
MPQLVILMKYPSSNTQGVYDLDLSHHSFACLYELPVYLHALSVNSSICVSIPWPSPCRGLVWFLDSNYVPSHDYRRATQCAIGIKIEFLNRLAYAISQPVRLDTNVGH